MEHKIEFHLHVKGTSHCAKENPATIIADYKPLNYSGIVCTNHWNSSSMPHLKGFTFKRKLNSFINVFKDFKEQCEKEGIKVYFGLELSLHKRDYRPGRFNCFEILVYGITLNEFIEYNKKLIHLTNAELKALADEKGWVLIQSHPYRNQSMQLPIEYVHGYEVFNSHKGHTERNEQSLLLCQKVDGIGTCGSDYHNKGMQRTAVIFNELPKDEKDLARLLKAKSFTLSHPSQV